MNPFRTLFFALICAALLPLHLSAQPDPMNPENQNLAVPANWEVRLDNPNADITIGAEPDSADIYFVNMTPGWHITTGPRAIFWHPESTAQETFKTSTKIHLFDPKGRNEAFGLFFGGQNLEQSDQSYTYFLLRNSGEYLIKKRVGDETEVIQNWSKAPSMVQYSDTTKSSVPNVLSVEANANEVLFFVNDQQVASLPKSQLQTNGIVGLRINHALNLHIEDFSVESL